MSENYRRILMWVAAALIGFWGWSGGRALAGEIPAFKPIPQGISADEKDKLNRVMGDLKAEEADLQAKAEAYNAETADQQTAAQRQALETEEASIRQGVKSFNQEVLADVNQDTSVVDTRGAEETLPRQAEEIEKSPAYREARKGYQAIIHGLDWQAASAWYQQALLKDPDNPALKRMAGLCSDILAFRKAHNLPLLGPAPFTPKAPENDKAAKPANEVQALVILEKKLKGTEYEAAVKWKLKKTLDEAVAKYEKEADEAMAVDYAYQAMYELEYSNNKPEAMKKLQKAEELAPSKKWIKKAWDYLSK